jgi:hypothetical protein
MAGALTRRMAFLSRPQGGAPLLRKFGGEGVRKDRFGGSNLGSRAEES